MSEATEKMVQAIADESPTDFEKSFNVAMADKVVAALAQKKTQVAAGILERGDEEEAEEDVDEASTGSSGAREIKIPRVGPRKNRLIHWPAGVQHPRWPAGVQHPRKKKDKKK